MTEEETAADGLAIGLFGGLSITVAGRDVTARLPGKKGRTLVAYLAACHPKGATREQLVDVLWPSGLPADPRASLRSLLSRVRRALGEDRLAEGRELALAVDARAIDLARAREHAAKALDHRRAGRLEQAVMQARAAVEILDRPFLPAISAEWTTPICSSIHEEVSEMLACIAEEGSLVGGEVGQEAIAAARELVERDPQVEGNHARLMLALARAGENGEALRVYERQRQRAIEELGAAPGPELQALHARILNGEDLRPAAAGRVARERRGAELPLPPTVLAAAERPFVGREAELGRIERARTVAGGERIVLVAGQPGIGKSRLICEAAARAAAAGQIVLFGRCDPELATPYQPFVEGIGHLVRNTEHEDLAALLGNAREDLARIIPELGETSDVPGSEPDTQRHRLFDAVASVLQRLADRGPVLLVIDDLHWADRPTQLLFRYVERALRGLDATLLVAYRDTESDQTKEFASLLADVRREREVVAIELDGMGAEEIRELIETEASKAAPDEFVAFVSERTGGNPLFAREMTRDLVGAIPNEASWPGEDQLRDWPVPDGIHQLVRTRIEMLPADSPGLLVRAATLGRVVRPDELAATAEVSLSDALIALEAAESAGLTAESRSEPGAFVFRHPLIRESLVGGLSGARRAHLHLENASRLEQHWADELDDHLPEITHHRLEAAVAGLEVESAVEWAVRAAKHSEDRLAYEQGVALYKRALDLLGNDPAVRRRRAELMLDLAAAQWRAGDRDASRSTRHAAFDIGGELDDPDLMAAAAVGHERYFELVSFEADEEAIVRQALAAIPDGRTPRRARLLSRLSRIEHWTGDPALTVAPAREAVEIAREAGDEEALAEALNALLFAYREPSHPIPPRLEAADELIEIARRLDSDERRLEGEAHRLLALVEGGRAGEVRGAVERFGRIVQGLRQPFWVYFRQAWAATLAFSEGDMTESERLHALATETATGARSDAADGAAAATVQRAVEQGRAAEVADLAARFTAEGVHQGVWSAGVAMVLARAGRVEEAEEALAELVGPEGLRLKRDVLWSLAACLLADAAHAIGAREAAAVIYRELEPNPSWIAMAGTARGFFLVRQRLGQLAQVLGDHASALVHLAEAKRQAEDVRAPLLAAWADIERAATLLARDEEGDRAEARELIDHVEAFAEGRGLGLLEQRIAALRSKPAPEIAFAV